MVIPPDPSLPIRNNIANVIKSVGSANVIPNPEGYRSGSRDVVVI